MLVIKVKFETYFEFISVNIFLRFMAFFFFYCLFKSLQLFTNHSMVTTNVQQYTWLDFSYMWNADKDQTFSAAIWSLPSVVSCAQRSDAHRGCSTAVGMVHTYSLPFLAKKKKSPKKVIEHLFLQG